MRLRRFVVRDRIIGEYVATFYAETMRLWPDGDGVNLWIGDNVVGQVGTGLYEVFDSGGTSEWKELHAQEA